MRTARFSLIFKAKRALYWQCKFEKNRWLDLKVFFAAAILAASALPVLALDVYSSTDIRGQTRWATQALDASYQKTISTPDPQPVNSFAPTLILKSAQRAALDQRRQEFLPIVDKISRQYDVDTSLVMALIEVESGFNFRAISPKGARGLMQLMPTTASRYGMREVQELYEPQRNLDIGIRHLKDLLVAHGGQQALAMASYNAGQYAVSKHGQRIPRYRETMLYVPAVLSIAARYAADNAVSVENLK